MKRILTLMLILAAALGARAQQAVEDRRTGHPFAFAEFQRAKVLQPFGRYTYATANIFLKDSRLVFKDGDTVKTAYVQNVYGVEFGDSITYLRIDSIMGRVVARHGYNTLLCVTTIDMARLRSLTTGGENLPFFEVPDLGLFLETNGDNDDLARGYPLKDTYYFMVKGTPYRASEKIIRRIVKPEMQAAFKRLMNDHYWSWNDAASLEKLFIYLPE